MLTTSIGTMCHRTLIISLTIFPVLSILFPWFMHPITKTWMSTPLHSFCPSLPLTSGNHQFVLCVYQSDSAFCLLIHLFCLLDSTYEWNHMIPYHLLLRCLKDQWERNTSAEKIKLILNEKVPKRYKSIPLVKRKLNVG